MSKTQDMLIKPEGFTRRVPYFGGQSLDKDPDFRQYWHFCGTIIGICTDRKPYKRGNTS